MTSIAGKRIKNIRKIKKISIRELSRLSGVNVSYISKLEKGDNNNPSVEIITKIANALNMTTYDLIKEDELTELDIEMKGKINRIKKEDISSIQMNLTDKLKHYLETIPRALTVSITNEYENGTFPVDFANKSIEEQIEIIEAVKITIKVVDQLQIERNKK